MGKILLLHPKSLAVCKIGGVSDHVRDIFHSTTEIYEMGEETTALHIKIGMWHADLESKGETPLLERLAIKNVLVPRQSLLFQVDPTNTRPLNELE